MAAASHAFAALLHHAKSAFSTHETAQAFAPFPDDVTPQPVTPHHIPAADLLAAERGLSSDKYVELRDAIVTAGAAAHWRETYKDTDIGQDFMNRFGCYAIIGNGGAYQSAALWMWMVYMPPNLHYPWHHHPGEELYLVVAGEASFHRSGMASEILGAGETVYHASNQPHAMTTQDHPVLCLVAWRNGFDIAPVLTEF